MTLPICFGVKSWLEQGEDWRIVAPGPGALALALLGAKLLADLRLAVSVQLSPAV